MNFMTSRRSVTIALTAAAWGLSAPAMAAAPAQPAHITVQHAKGTATVPLKPQRVVVYDLAALDAMQALQLPVAGVAKAQYPDYLAAYADAKYQAAGTLFIPDYEALSRIQPDLIVVAGRSAAQYEVLSKIAPTLDLSVNNQRLLDDMERNVTTLSSLWGKQAEGRQLMARVRGEVDSLKAVAAQAEPGLLVLAVNRNMSAQPPGARFGLLHDVLGIKPGIPADPSKPRGVPVKMEDIAKLDPAWIYVIDRNAGTGTQTDKDGKPVVPSKQLFDNAQIRATQAGQKGRVVFLDPKGWYLLGSAGPTAMLRNVGEIKGALQAGR
ncbi:siderophore ABC transporter substrate-binding protein [Comamonas endophytica]|uniref:Siderophore ABC transporter substrate-binding protein n=2 Tax=Comamonas endophytica TaxID=2949090 RepID=A0ABY6G662_9BURK|nr:MULTISPECIES: siderophore ABC transporter substrate-binding protein [unclassified Acidovorax]MCD2510980.1 siderophore ABC transporter substrate-binding protein [Acidovorax sp. D4N7]UYG50388.1 siderophore ABC transporter substrate-binding protein [Acidovorax sp. 5MLIR]